MLPPRCVCSSFCAALLIVGKVDIVKRGRGALVYIPCLYLRLAMLALSVMSPYVVPPCTTFPSTLYVLCTLLHCALMRRWAQSRSLTLAWPSPCGWAVAGPLGRATARARTDPARGMGGASRRVRGVDWMDPARGVPLTSNHPPYGSGSSLDASSQCARTPPPHLPADPAVDLI